MTAWCCSSPNFCVRGYGLSDGEVEELKKMEEERGRGLILSYFSRYLNVINFCSAVVCKYSHTFAKSLSAFNVKVEKWNKEAYIKKVYATA